MAPFRGSLIDHVNLAVSEVERSRAFYEAALAPLGIALNMKMPPEVSDGRGPVYGFGVERKPFFWIFEASVGERTHVAFTAESRDAVHAFHAAALEAGGRDNGGPGIREIYHPGYYGAFVLDPDGINVEAVIHEDA